MSLDDTQSSAEIIMNSVIHGVCCELNSEQSPSTDYESIHSTQSYTSWCCWCEFAVMRKNQ